MKLCLKLFLTMFKIGLFTFGGGYAMIAVFENEFVSNKKWIEQEEFTDLIAIAESTPGPIAINSSTYIGYKVAGVLGSVFATLGMVLPSLLIIFTISLFLNEFLQIQLVSKAFKGIQACVAFLILSAGLKMFIKSKKTVFSIIVFALVCLSVILCTIFGVDFSSIYYILLGALAGLIVYLIAFSNKMKKSTPAEKNNKVGGQE
ncbi:MAG: chromate transporter [Clostridia bacterium]|nr:chromate transporter [Clostridia bacterium]